jgi:hypothetical protein
MVALEAAALAPMSEAEHEKCLRRAVIASTVGTTIEWYDFLIYSTVTGLVFGRAPIGIYICICAVISITATLLLPDYTNKDIALEHQYGNV